MELNNNHIRELDGIINNSLKKEYKVLTQETLEQSFNIDRSKSKFYLEALERQDLIELDNNGQGYFIRIEHCKIHIQKGGFEQLALDQKNELDKEIKKENIQNELSELQLKQLKFETTQMIVKSWWFWLAAAIVLYTFISQLINDFS